MFDFPEEKFLVTEYVRGGDLFDAIAVDTKYSENVSRYNFIFAICHWHIFYLK